jgi:hypothetical protein
VGRDDRGLRQDVAHLTADQGEHSGDHDIYEHGISIRDTTRG